MTDNLDLSQIVSASVKGKMSGTRVDWDSSRLGLESIVSASVDGQTSGTRVNSFGHIMCKEDPCLTVVGKRELTKI